MSHPPRRPDPSLDTFDRCWFDPAGPAELSSRWQALWDRLGMDPRPGLFETVLARWREPHRSYHTPQHLLECLRVLDHLRSYCTAEGGADAVEFALWYHDVIYSTTSSGSEERSAEMACATMLKSAPRGQEQRAGQLASTVFEAIMATTHEHSVRTLEAAVTVDCDLAILGAPAERYAQFEDQVRQEYAQFALPHFASARLRVLEGFASRKQIYRTPLLRQLLETRARENLARSMRALRRLTP